MSPTPPYVELHCHSGFSFLDGASHPEELVLRAAELGYPALALTDHDGLYGSMEFARAARAEEIQPITGAEVTVEVASHLEGFGGPATRRPPEGMAALPGAGAPRVPGPADAAGASLPDDPLRRHAHLTLLAETPAGYANLCRLLSESHLAAGERGERGLPALPFSSLRERAEGLICLTGCRRGPLALGLADSVSTAEAAARALLDVFGPHGLFVELQENRVRGDGARNRALGRLADRLGLPVVATGNVHYHRPSRHRLQDVLVAVRNRTTLDGSHGMRRPNAAFHLPSPDEAARRFRSRPDALAATLEIAERCAAFDLTRDLGYEFPDFEGSERGDAITNLAAVCLARLEERYPVQPGNTKDRARREEADRRLHEELRLVDLHGLAGFFLVYRDIMGLAREVAAEVRGDAPRARSELPPGRGRGSSVSSIICYLIGLSHVDPVETNLFLGRFLNEALGSVPDIDLDFPREIREELILAVYERYGSEHAGLVCTFPTYRLRSAVREVGKALDLPPGELEKLSKLAEHRSAASIGEELEGLPEFRERKEAPLWRALAALGEEIAGLPRHVSQHVGGMIISSRPLVELVPLEPAAMEGRVLCQWDKDSCEDAGFIKIDFLALGMLSLVEEAVDLVAEREGTPPDLSRIDFHDEAVYDRICDGDTIGIFQVESRAQIQMLRRVRPRDLAELAVQVAIVRPGPIVGGAVNPYVRRREGQREDPDFEVPFDHPLLEEPLGETLGVIIYQDQVLTVCRALAGFSDGQAESLRRAMSRKRSREAMETHREAFLRGAAAKGVDEATAEHVFAQVVAFSEFGFPKSHAAAFALLAYQSAWLRHYHPTEYYVALFNNQPMGFYSLDALGRDARRNGVRILLPDVNRSGVRCLPEDGDLRVGLGFVRDWGQDVAEAVVAERQRGGPFRSLPDFLRRTPAALKRPAVENLIWVGGFEALGLARRELLWQAGLWLGPEEDGRRGAGRAGGGVGPRSDHAQLALELEEPYDDLPFPDLDDADRMVAEYRMLRFSAVTHPLSLFRERLAERTVSSDVLPDLPDGSSVTVAGIVVARQRPATAKGYVFVLMEDEAGPVNVIVKPPVYQRSRSVIRAEPFLTVRGRLQKDRKTLNVIARRVEALRLHGNDDGSEAASGSAARRRDEGGGTDGRARAPAGPSDAELHPALPHWPDPSRAKKSAYRYLTALRRTPPGVKSFG